MTQSGLRYPPPPEATPRAVNSGERVTPPPNGDVAPDISEVAAAKTIVDQAILALDHNPSFRQLDFQSQAGLRTDLAKIKSALARTPERALATAQATPYDRFRQPQESEPSQIIEQESPTEVSAPRQQATETIAARTGALIDEVNFTDFVASLVSQTFDAMLDTSIRQMEAFADLVSAVAKDLDRFTEDNVSDHQAMDWLVERYPRDLRLEFNTQDGGQPVVRPTTSGDEFGAEPPSPAWMSDFGMEGEELTEEVVQQSLVPVARKRLAENRLQMLATMVLMGMNRIVVKDGHVSAKVRFRSAARDRAKVDFATSQDPGGPSWGSRGSSAYEQSTMMISTVGANAQSDSDIRAELYGEVKINFESETIPLDQFVDAAQMAFLRQNANSAIPETTTADSTAASTTEANSGGAAPPSLGQPVGSQPVGAQPVGAQPIAAQPAIGPSANEQPTTEVQPS